MTRGRIPFLRDERGRDHVPIDAYVPPEGIAEIDQGATFYFEHNHPQGGYSTAGGKGFWFDLAQGKNHLEHETNYPSAASDHVLFDEELLVQTTRPLTDSNKITVTGWFECADFLEARYLFAQPFGAANRLGLLAHPSLGLASIITRSTGDGNWFVSVGSLPSVDTPFFVGLVVDVPQIGAPTSDAVKIYQDGSFVSGASATNNDVAVLAANDEEFILGDASEAGFLPFEGKVNKLAGFNGQSLSDAELDVLHAVGSPF